MTRMNQHRPALYLTGRISVSALAVSVMLLGLTGCDEEDLRAYQAPKSAPYVQPELLARIRAPVSGTAATPEPAGIAWDVPEVWAEAPGTSSFLTAVFEAKGETGDARITVSRLSNDGGGVLANINRWRGQVGLGPIQAYEQQPMTPIVVAGQTAGLIDLTAPEGDDAGLDRLVVVFIPRPRENLTWYFKMTGPAGALDEHKPAFVSFVESVRFGVEAVDKPGEQSGGESGGGQ